MNNNDIIASIYQIIENIEYFEAEQLFLVQNVNDNNQYWLQHIDLKNRSDSQIELIKDKINKIKSLPGNERFAKLIEIKEEDNSINLIYEKVQGISLDKKLTNYQDKSEAEIIKLIKYVLESLKLIHDHGFVHHMINPKNMIMDTDKNHLVINNYGKITTDLYSSLMATISVEDTVYITQEQLRGQASFSCDIYALGMVIISSIMGINVLNLDENELGLLNWSEQKDYTPNFRDIINKMINSKINQRYSNVDDILADVAKHFSETSNNNLDNKPNYTPTEIIFAETHKEQQQEKTSSSEPVLNTTQVSIPDDSVKEDKSVYASDVSNMAATEFVAPSETEIKKNNLSLDKIDSADHSHKQEIEIISGNSHLIDNVSVSADQLSNSASQDQLISKSKLSLNNSWIHLLKTPKGILGLFFLILMIVIGGHFYKNHLETKKVEQLTTNIEKFYKNNEFDNCIALINSSQTQALVIAEQITEQFLGKCWLGLAQLEASKGNLTQAIDIAVKINYKSADYARARQFIDDWSKQLLKEAQIICEKGGNLSSVRTKLAGIPQSSKWKKDALNLIENCKKKPSTGSTIDLCPGPLCPE